jgi:hypothetical protein
MDEPGTGFALTVDGRTVPLDAAAADARQGVEPGVVEPGVVEPGVVVLDLGGLPDGAWTGEVLVDGGPVWVPPSVGDAPVLPPVAPPGDHRFVVGRTRRGVLVLERRAIAPVVEVEGFALTDAGITVRLPAGTTGRVLLVSGHDVRSRLPVISDESGPHVVVGTGDLPAGPDGTDGTDGADGTDGTDGTGRAELDFVLDDGSAVGLPLGRRDHTLARPGATTVLPTLYDAGTDRPRLRLRWHRRGTLAGILIG